MSTGKKILIVDDSPSIRQVVRLNLVKAGHEVAEAANGVEALELLAAGKYDLVVSDLNMPRMDGLTFIGKLRDIADGKFVPVIMLTTESTEDKKMQGLALGVRAWLVKPFTPEKLVSAVEKLAV